MPPIVLKHNPPPAYPYPGRSGLVHQEQLGLFHKAINMATTEVRLREQLRVKCFSTKPGVVSGLVSLVWETELRVPVVPGMDLIIHSRVATCKGAAANGGTLGSFGGWKGVPTLFHLFLAAEWPPIIRAERKARS